MERFVCVRIADVNPLDLSLFQFNPDLTFAVFFLNADRTIYGRYGSRSDLLDAERDVSLEGLRASMDAALALHRDYPSNKASLTAKTGPPARFVATPSEFPWIAKNVKPYCVHCHHIGLAERLEFRTAGEPVPDKLFYAWPMPKVVGLELDPTTKTTVKRVVPGSAAERAAFKPGDEIRTLAGQAVLSTADVQWVLTHADEAAALEAQVGRVGRVHTLTLNLEKGWRRKSDLSWRPTTWYLRHVLVGDLALEELLADQHREAGIGHDKLALRHHRRLTSHAAAYSAGFRQGDILVRFDGMTDRMSEMELLAYTLNNRAPGDEIPVTVLRAGEILEFKLRVE